MGYVRYIEGKGFLMIVDFEDDWGISGKILLVSLPSVGEAQDHGLRFIFERDSISRDI